MTGPEADVVAHYSSDDLYERILEALSEMGKFETGLTPDDLKPVDEFHIGGIAATDNLLAHLDIKPGDRVLDIGCGIGGAARHVASRLGARPTGVDLTPAFVETARRLTALVGLDAEFEVGSALDLPVEDASFDVALMLHVGMNLADKDKLFREAARALKPGGAFALYDIMAKGDGAFDLPVPWASEGETSYVATPDAYRAAGEAAGLDLEVENDRTKFACAFFDRLAAGAGRGPAPPLGLPILMGPTAPVKYGNMVNAVRAGGLAPVEMIFRKPA